MPKSVTIKTVQSSHDAPLTAPLNNKRKKRRVSYKDMMASIIKSDKTAAEKIQEKREALKTPSAEPPKLVTI